VTAPAYAVRRPYTYEPGEPTAASTSPRAAAPGASSNHPAERHMTARVPTYAYEAPAVAEENARLREPLDAYEPAELAPVAQGGNSR